jgi:hypothetical protein
MIDAFASFTLSSVRHGEGFGESDLKNLARQLQIALGRQGFVVGDAGDLFGASTDLWAFSVTLEGFEISVGISPDYRSPEDRWSAQVHLQDPGWFKQTRAKRMAELKRIEWAVHDALRSDLGGRDIEWLIGKGRLRQGEGQPTP